MAVGRLKWIPGLKHTGKDNYAWFRFDARHTSRRVSHCRDQGEILPGTVQDMRAVRQGLNAAALQLAVLFGGVQNARMPRAFGVTSSVTAGCTAARHARHARHHQMACYDDKLGDRNDCGETTRYHHE